MPNKCFVQWCFSGYKSQKRENKISRERNKSMFQAPKDPELRNKWHEALGRTNRILSPSDSVCELHFDESDLLRFFETKMPDGSIHRIPRRCNLKPGAIPKILAAIDSPIKSECRESTKDDKNTVLEPVGNTVASNDNKTIICNEKNIKIQTIQNTQSSGVSILKNKVLVISQVLPNNQAYRTVIKSVGYTIENLREDITKFSLPQKWAYIFSNDEIHFRCWNTQPATTITVFVKSDMTATVGRDADRVTETKLLNLTSFDKFRNSLTILGKEPLCEGTGIDDGRASSCYIFLGDLKTPYRRPIQCSRCLPCRVLRQQERAARKQRKNTDSNQKVKALKREQLLIAIRRKNARLEKKVLKLQTVIEIQRRKVPLSIKTPLK